ncbi:MAG: hypothetical protein EXQ77_01405 [Thermoleophilia bacterium]|nr:hypothetical protein [Thermoleophilia bacterium]
MSVRALLGPLLVVLLASAAPAAADPGADKAAIDREITVLREQARIQSKRIGVLSDELRANSDRVTELRGAVGAQEKRLRVLSTGLGRARARLETLDVRIADQTRRLEFAQQEHLAAVGLLETRIRGIYLADEPDILSFAIGTITFTDLIDNMELLARIGQQDRVIVRRVAAARDAIWLARRTTREARVEAALLTSLVWQQKAEQRQVFDRLAATRNALEGAQADRQAAVTAIESDRGHVLETIGSLERESAELAAAIQAAQRGEPVGAQPVQRHTGRLGWPVSGTVVSGFGPRGGAMHEGIDITCASGTHVKASGSGRIIYAGWLGGYGNLVVVDHGGGLSTAYAHNTSFAVRLGQDVQTGTVIAYAGSTGRSSGPHVHFEVRVDGKAVDPMGYL